MDDQPPPSKLQRVRGSFRDSLDPKKHKNYDEQTERAQMALLEAQNRKRLEAAKRLSAKASEAEIDPPPRDTFPSPPPQDQPFSSPNTIADTRALLKQHHRRWVEDAEKSQANSISGPSFTHGKVSQPSSKSSARFAPYPLRLPSQYSRATQNNYSIGTPITQENPRIMLDEVAKIWTDFNKLKQKGLSFPTALKPAIEITEQKIKNLTDLGYPPLPSLTLFDTLTKESFALNNSQIQFIATLFNNVNTVLDILRSENYERKEFYKAYWEVVNTYIKYLSEHNKYFTQQPKAISAALTEYTFSIIDNAIVTFNKGCIQAQKHFQWINILPLKTLKEIELFASITQDAPNKLQESKNTIETLKQSFEVEAARFYFLLCDFVNFLGTLDPDESYQLQGNEPILKSRNELLKKRSGVFEAAKAAETSDPAQAKATEASKAIAKINTLITTTNRVHQLKLKPPIPLLFENPLPPTPLIGLRR